MFSQSTDERGSVIVVQSAKQNIMMQCPNLALSLDHRSS